MKIQVIHMITMLELGGAQQNTLYTVAHLDRSRFQPHLMVGPGGILDSEARRLPDVLSHFLPNLIREVRPHHDLLALRRIRAKVRQVIRAHPGSPVVVHTHSSKAGILGRWAAWLEGVPIIIHTYHGFGFHGEQKPWARWTFQRLEQWAGRITHKFIMVSRANMDTARRCGIASREGMVLIRSGIPIGDFQEPFEPRERIRHSLGVEEPGESIVTMISCLKPQKAPKDFVAVAERVAAEAPGTRFLLVGDGVLRPQVEATVQASGLGGRFSLLGWRRDVPKILHATDVLVLTSRWEGLPRVLPQAMAAGVPAVATRVDGSPEAIQDGVNGFLLAPGDVDGMALRVLQLLKDPELRVRMAHEGRQRVGEFDIERMVSQQESLYEELVSRKAN